MSSPLTGENRIWKSGAQSLQFASGFLLITIAIAAMAGVPIAHAVPPIVRDSVAGGVCGPVAVCSWPQTVNTGPNGILIVGISTDTSHGVQSVSSVTFGGFPLTWIARSKDPNNNVLATMWYLLNPPHETAQIQVTFSSTPLFGTVGGSVSYSNVAGIGGHNTNAGLSNPASVSVNANTGDLVVGVLSAGAQSSLSPGANQLWNTVSGAGGVLGAGSDEAVFSSGQETMSWSGIAAGNNWAMVAVDLQSLSSQPSSCGFLLSVAPVVQTVVQGQSAVFALSVTPTNPSCIPSFTNVNMLVTGLGPGMNYQFGASSLIITTDPMTPPGVYSISLIMGTQQVQMTVIVTQATSSSTTIVPPTTSTTAFSFSMTVSPSTESVQNGGNTSYIVSIVPVAGTPVPVSLTVTGLPASVSSSFTPASGTPPYTSTLSVNLSTSTASPGSYTVTVVGTAAGTIQSATATLIIQQAPTTSSATTTTESSQSAAPTSEPPYDLIILALVVVVVLLAAAFFMKGRGPKTSPAT